jgi:hypothetical protein
VRWGRKAAGLYITDSRAAKGDRWQAGFLLLDKKVSFSQWLAEQKDKKYEIDWENQAGHH